MDADLAAREAGLPIPHRASRAFDETNPVPVDGKLGHDCIPHPHRRVVPAKELRHRRFRECGCAVELRLMKDRHRLEPANAGRDDALVTGLLVDDTLGCGHRCVDPQRLLALGDLAGAATFGGDPGPGLV